MKKLFKDYTVHYVVANSDYGIITVPKGTTVTNKTALGSDDNYNFVSDLKWIDKDYPSIANVLKHDVTYYGINVPKEYVVDTCINPDNIDLSTNPKINLIPVHINKARTKDFFYDWDSGIKAWIRGSAIPEKLKRMYQNPKT